MDLEERFSVALFGMGIVVAILFMTIQWPH